MITRDNSADDFRTVNKTEVTFIEHSRTTTGSYSLYDENTLRNIQIILWKLKLKHFNRVSNA